MQYTPHSHSALIDGTVAALLWEAADYLASEPETPVDPLSRIGDGALKAGRITTTIYFAAVDLAIHVTIADYPDTNRDFDWANWGDSATSPPPTVTSSPATPEPAATTARAPSAPTGY
ncbi:hypothetical protein [Gordonia aurantiaca]|uniref:hypothetical protein n=1 Tax=Gordonia sp. B21 TaxID=3151852 RepID=UPI003267A325